MLDEEPDGDAVRFRADDPGLPAGLEHDDRVRLSGDTTVQLRFDGVDAPERHHQGRAQPRGDTARDALLAHLGSTGLTYDGARAVAATPTTLPATVLSRLVEVNGRPVALLLPPRPDLFRPGGAHGAAGRREREPLAGAERRGVPAGVHVDRCGDAGAPVRARCRCTQCCPSGGRS